MKLLLCRKCVDVRKLLFTSTACTCGATWGRYVDEVRAEWGGDGFLIGFSNPSLTEALRTQVKEGDRQDGMGRTFTAFVIPDGAPSVTRIHE